MATLASLSKKLKEKFDLEVGSKTYKALDTLDRYNKAFTNPKKIDILPNLDQTKVRNIPLNMAAGAAEYLVNEPRHQIGDIGVGLNKIITKDTNNFNPNSSLFKLTNSVMDMATTRQNPLSTVQLKGKQGIGYGKGKWEVPLTNINIPEMGFSESPLAKMGSQAIDVAAPFAAVKGAAKPLAAGAYTALGGGFNTGVSALSGDTNYKKNFIEGANTTARKSAAFTGFSNATNPLLDAIGGKALTRLPLKSAANVAQGIGLDQTTDMETTPESLLLDALFPLAGELKTKSFKSADEAIRVTEARLKSALGKSMRNNKGMYTTADKFAKGTRAYRKSGKYMQGGLLGFEPYQDEDGSWKVRFNRERALVGLGATVGAGKAGKFTDDVLRGVDEKQVDPLIAEARKYKTPKAFEDAMYDKSVLFPEQLESLAKSDRSLTDIWNQATKTTQSPELSTKDTGLSKPQEGLLNPKTDMQKFDPSRTSLSNILALTGKSTGVAGETFNIQDLNPPVDRKQGVKLSKQLLKGEQKAAINLKKQNIKDAATIIAKSIKENTSSKVQKEVKASGGVLSNSHAWKDKAKLLLKRETMERNFEDIMGADAPKMKQVYIDPIKKSEADRMRFLNKERSDIAKLGIAPKSRESELLQRFGEKQIDAATLKKQAPESYEKIIRAEKVFREKYDRYLTDINLALTRNGYDPIPKRKDYFRHFNEVGSVLEQFGIPVKDDLIPTDIVGLTADFRPGKNFFASALPRLGKMTEVDAIRGIDKYLDGASNQIYHTDNIQRMRGLERSLRGMHAGTGQLSNFVAELTEYTNKLAGKKSMIDRGAEDLVGRKFYSGANFLKRQTGSNMIGLNVASALTNFIPFTQSLATTSKDAAIQGLTQTMKNIYRDDGFAKKSDFLTSRIGADPLYRTAWENAQDKGFYLMRVVDRFVSESVVRGKYLEGLQKGMSDPAAIKYADDYAGKLLGNRSKGMMPTLFESQTLGALTQFQLEVNNQLSYMFKDVPRMYDKKGAASALAQIFLYSYLFNEAFEKVTGRRPAFDPIGVAIDTYEDYTNEDMKKGQATKNLIGNVANQLPFASVMTGGRIPLANALPNPVAVATGESTLKKEASDMFFGLVPPTAGNQLRKTLQGLQSYSQGSSKAPSGGVRFPIEQSGANLARTALFGQYSVPEARSYFREGRTPLGEKQTATFDSSVDKGSYYESVLQDRRDNRQNDIVRERVAQTGQEETSNGRLFYMGNETDSKTGEVKKVVKSLDVSDIEQTNAETGLGKYIITTETGNKAIVDLSKPLEKPKTTGQKELDKELVSRYNSSITTRINNIEKVYLDGQITAEEAEKAISELKAKKISTGKAKKKGVRVSMPKITFAKADAISKTNIKPSTFKLKKAPKLKLSSAPTRKATIKLAKKSYAKGKPIKFKNTLSESLTKLA